MAERFRLALMREPAVPPFGVAVAGPGDLANFARRLLQDEPQEVVVCLHLDQRHRLRGLTEVARGGIAAAQVDMRILFGAVLLSGVPAIALCHNHPSGDPHPSPDDRALTGRVQRSAELLGVELLDHLIVAPNGFVSLKGGGEF